MDKRQIDDGQSFVAGMPHWAGCSPMHPFRGVEAEVGGGGGWRG